MNLDIEGTKHEKVVIIVLSYVMGFTAGFICYGIGMRHTEAPVQPAVQMVAEVPDEPVEELGAVSEPIEDNEVVREMPTINPGDVTATYENGRLEAQVGTDTYLLSMKSSNLKGAALEAFENQGIHTDIPAYAVSLDGKYVYFCEQSTAEATCKSFVFDVTKNLISYVTLDGEKLVTSDTVAKAATWDENGLTIGGNSSADPKNPAALLNR